MTKTAYLEQLKKELDRLNVADAEEILQEYEQHFAFKLADGYSEEEIAAKLGAPGSIAAQFAAGETNPRPRGKGTKILLGVWLTLLGILEAALDIAFAAFGVGVFGAAVASAAVGTCLIGRFNVFELIPSMPYSGAILLGVCLLALAILFFVLTVYCFSFLRQFVRASVRWRKNVLSGTTLPLLPLGPQFAPKKRRALRNILLFSLVVFGVSFVVGYAVLALQASSLEFWHVYEWFV
jgi:uncharacterized membrane protein